MESITAPRRRWENPVGCELGLLIQITADSPKRSNGERLALVLNQLLNMLWFHKTLTVDFTYERWRDLLPWLSPEQIRHAFRELEEMGYVARQPHRDGVHFGATEKCYLATQGGDDRQSAPDSPPDALTDLTDSLTEEEVPSANALGSPGSPGDSLPGLEPPPSPSPKPTKPEKPSKPEKGEIDVEPYTPCAEYLAKFVESAAEKGYQTAPWNIPALAKAMAKSGIHPDKLKAGLKFGMQDTRYWQKKLLKHAQFANGALFRDLVNDSLSLHKAVHGSSGGRGRDEVTHEHRERGVIKLK